MSASCSPQRHRIPLSTGYRLVSLPARLKRPVRTATAVVGLTLVGRALGFLFPVLILREFDTQAAGLAYFLINTAYFVVQPISGGPAIAMIRPIAASGSEPEQAQWFHAATITVFPAVLISVLIGVLLCLTSAAPVPPMLILIAGLTTDAMYFQLLTAHRRYVEAATYRLVANVAQLLALLAMLFVGLHSVIGAVIIFSSSYLAGIFFTEIVRPTLLSVLRLKAKATRSQRRILLITAIPTSLTGLAYSGLTGLDTYIVRLIHPDVVATYGAAKALTAPVLLVSLALTTMIQPEIARRSKGDAALARHRLIRVASLGVVGAVAASWALAGFAITVIYGARYPEATMALRWLATGTAILGFTTLLQSWCWARAQYLVPLVSLGCGAAVALIADLLLVPSLKATGGGVAMSLGSATSAVLIVLLSRPTQRDAGNVTGALGRLINLDPEP
jgi:O-antigen/teichoic acid export membrane protein